MVSRRSFVSGLLGGSALISSRVSRRATVASSVASSVGASLAAPQALSGSGEAWKEDSRWGQQYWRVNRQPIEWPNKARIAFLCSIPFESYDVGEEPGQSTASVSNVFYGGKVGVWRILDILDRHNAKGNFITNGFCAVQFPEAIKAIVDRGHEIVGHFWANNIMEESLDEERDRALIRRSVSVIERVSGKRPVAWVAPGWRLGPRSLEALVEEGFTSHANSPSSDDLPYTVTIAGKKMVVVVQETVLNDNGFFNNFNSPSTFVDYLKRDFDRKYAEAATSGGRIVNFVLHAHLAGRPFMADALNELIAYTKTFPDVWYTTRQPVVDWWLERNYS